MLFIITTHEGITAHVLWLLVVVVVVVIVFVWFRGLCQSYHNPRDHVFNNGQYHVYRCISHHMSSSSQFNCSTASAILYSIQYSITKHMFPITQRSSADKRSGLSSVCIILFLHVLPQDLPRSIKFIMQHSRLVRTSA